MRARWTLCIASLAFGCGAPAVRVELEPERVAFPHVVGWEAFQRPRRATRTEFLGDERTSETSIDLAAEVFTAFDPDGQAHAVVVKRWPGTDIEDGLVLADGAWWRPGTWTFRITQAGGEAAVSMVVTPHGQDPDYDRSTPSAFTSWIQRIDSPDTLLGSVASYGVDRVRVVGLDGPDPRLIVYAPQDIPSYPEFCRAATVPLTVDANGLVTGTLGERALGGRWPLRIDGGTMRFGLADDPQDWGPRGVELELWVDAEDLAPHVSPPLALTTGDEACDLAEDVRPCEPCVNRPDRSCVVLTFGHGELYSNFDDPAWAASYDDPCLPPRAGQFDAASWVCAALGPAGGALGLPLLALAATRRRRQR